MNKERPNTTQPKTAPELLKYGKGDDYLTMATALGASFPIQETSEAITCISASADLLRVMRRALLPILDGSLPFEEDEAGAFYDILEVVMLLQMRLLQWEDSRFDKGMRDYLERQHETLARSAREDQARSAREDTPLSARETPPRSAREEPRRPMSDSWRDGILSKPVRETE